MSTPLSYIAPGRILIPNKASVVPLIGVEEDPSIKVLQIASVFAKKTYSVPGVLAHYIVFGSDKIISTGEPMRVNFDAAEDAVVFCYKVTGKIVSFYGITIEALIAWVPPKAVKEVIDESGLLQTWKSTHADIKELVPLVNTETHPHLKALAVKFMSHMPTFSLVKIKDAKGAQSWCDNTFTHNIKYTIDLSEVEARQRAKEKSQTAKDKSGTESRAGGEAAKTFWSERKRLVLAAAPYYKDTFADRFIEVALDESTGQPTKETIAELHESFK